MTKATRRQAPDERAATPPDIKQVSIKTHALAISYPHPTNLGEPVIQYSPSVQTPLQNLPHIKHTTTCPNHQAKNSYNAKRKRPKNPTLDREVTGDNSTPDTQQNIGNLKINMLPKDLKVHPPTPPSQQHCQSASSPRIHPVNARPNYTATDIHRTLTYAHTRNIP